VIADLSREAIVESLTQFSLLLKAKVGDWEPPDPEGRTGRKRHLWRRKLPDGTYEYSDTPPKGAKTETVAGPSPKTSKLAQEVESVVRQLRSSRQATPDLKRKSAELMKKFGERFREMKTKATTEHQKKVLEQISTRAKEFAQLLRDGFKKGDAEQIQKAYGILREIAEKLDKLDEREAGPAKHDEETGWGDFVYKKGALSSAPWEGHLEQVEKALRSDPVKREQAGIDSRTLVYFDQAPDGSKSVTKPDGLGPPISFMRRGILNEKVSVGAREAAAFEVDRLLGFGIVPPTVKTKTQVAAEDRARVVKQVLMHPELQAAYKENKLSKEALKELQEAALNPEASASRQHFVEGAMSGSDFSRAKTQMHFENDPDFRFSVEKMAVFDYLTGATDRHFGNYLVSADRKQAFAIDNGFNFPISDERGDFHGFTSVPHWLSHEYNGGKIDKRIVSQLQKVDEGQLKKTLEKWGLGKEANGVIARLRRIKEKGRLPRTLNMVELAMGARSLQTPKPPKPKPHAAEMATVAMALRQLEDFILKSENAEIMQVYTGAGKDQKLVGEIALKGDKVVVLSGEENPLVEYVMGGYLGPLGERITTNTPEKFVQDLPLSFCGSMVRIVPRTNANAPGSE